MLWVFFLLNCLAKFGGCGVSCRCLGYEMGTNYAKPRGWRNIAEDSDKKRG
jgi:hypothetical protein